jgi:hypothetical protein
MNCIDPGSTFHFPFHGFDSLCACALAALKPAITTNAHAPGIIRFIGPFLILCLNLSNAARMHVRRRLRTARTPHLSDDKRKVD